MTTTHVHIVDDDEALADSLGMLLREAGHEVTSFTTVNGFCDALTTLPSGCVLLDRHLPDADGVDLIGELKRERPDLAVILLTGHGDIGTAVRAMKDGAHDFIEKPFDPRALLALIAHLLESNAEKNAERTQAQEAAAKLDKLTPRERQVLDVLIEGLPHKIAAHRLGISPRTIEIHRAHALEKLGIRAITDAMRIVTLAGTL
jgi:two-component system response regulator FixJ